MVAVFYLIILLSILQLIRTQDIFFPDANELDKCETLSGPIGECRYPKDCPQLIQGKILGDKPKICGFNSASLYLICCPKVLASLVRGVSVPKIEFECGKRESVTTESSQDGTLRRRRQAHRFPPVVGGRPSRRNSWPWMALLGERRTKGGNTVPNFFCDGALINKRFILTAAHCLLDPKKFFVRLSEHNYQSDDDGPSPQDFEVESVTFHPDYDFALGYNDLALVKLDKDVLIADTVRPICIPWDKTSNQELVNTDTIVTGWGAESFGGPSSPVLQEVTVKIFSSSECEKQYSRLADFKFLFPQGMTSENIICAGDVLGGKDACQGDSGAPLVHLGPDNIHYVLAGIVSKGHGCGLKDFPGLYAPVRNQKAMEWIKETAFSP